MLFVLINMASTEFSENNTIVTFWPTKNCVYFPALLMLIYYLITDKTQCFLVTKKASKQILHEHLLLINEFRNAGKTMLIIINSYILISKTLLWSFLSMLFRWYLSQWNVFVWKLLPLLASLFAYVIFHSWKSGQTEK